jgi:hypothetical protein
VDALTPAQLKALIPDDLVAGARALGEEPPADRQPRSPWFGRRRT